MWRHWIHAYTRACCRASRKLAARSNCPLVRSRRASLLHELVHAHTFVVVQESYGHVGELHTLKREMPGYLPGGSFGDLPGKGGIVFLVRRELVEEHVGIGRGRTCTIPCRCSRGTPKEERFFVNAPGLYIFSDALMEKALGYARSVPLENGRRSGRCAGRSVGELGGSRRRALTSGSSRNVVFASQRYGSEVRPTRQRSLRRGGTGRVGREQRRASADRRPRGGRGCEVELVARIRAPRASRCA